MPKKIKMVVSYNYEPGDQGPVGIVDRVLENDFQMVDQILARDPSQINAWIPEIHTTSLMAASGRGLKEMVAHLVKKTGIDLDLVDADGRTALDYGRVYPDIVSEIMQAKYPHKKWKEPNLGPAPS